MVVFTECCNIKGDPALNFLFGHVLLVLATELTPKPLQASQSVFPLVPAMFTILCSPAEYRGAGLSSFLLSSRTLQPRGAEILPSVQVDQGNIGPVGGKSGPGV